jgi:hypothetical protein
MNITNYHIIALFHIPLIIWWGITFGRFMANYRWFKLDLIDGLTREQKLNVSASYYTGLKQTQWIWLRDKWGYLWLAFTILYSFTLFQWWESFFIEHLASSIFLYGGISCLFPFFYRWEELRLNVSQNLYETKKYLWFSLGCALGYFILCSIFFWIIE